MSLVKKIKNILKKKKPNNITVFYEPGEEN